MSPGYERKDNRLKTCVLREIGPKIIMWRIYSWLLSFCFLFLFFVLPFLLGFIPIFFLLCFCFSCLCFSCICTFLLLAGWVRYFSFKHQNLIVHDFWKDFSCICLQCGGWSLVRIMKEIIKLKRGNLGIISH